MEEAAEIAKLRLFLTLVSSANTLDDLEPLPNIDFNILAGNSLVGLLAVDETEYQAQRENKIAQERAKERAQTSGVINKPVAKITGQAPMLGVGEKTYKQIVDEYQREVDHYRANVGKGIKDLTALRQSIHAQRTRAYETLNPLLHQQFHDLGIKYEQATWDDVKGKEGKAIKRPVTLDDITALKPFHWAFEFAEVMARGGFDAVIANPPWDVVKPNGKEFLQSHAPTISKNKMLIKDFEKEKGKLLANPAIRKEWLEYQSGYPFMSAYFRAAPQFAHQSSTVNGKKTGSDLNLYKLFLEQSFRLLREGGECGIVIPSGVYTDLGAKGLRELLFNKSRITALYSLSNEKFLFEEVHHSFKFCILVFGKGKSASEFRGAFRINPREAIGKDKLREFLHDEGQHIIIMLEIVRRLAPDTLSVMEFKNEKDIEIAKKMLIFPLLGEELTDSWNLKLTREFDMAMDAALFNNSAGENRLPLFTGKMFHQFSPTEASSGLWIEKDEGRKALLGKKADTGQMLNYQVYRWVHRRIARSTDSRTMISTIAPKNVFTEANSTSMDVIDSDITETEMLAFTAVMNSFIVDWLLRQKINTTLNMFYIYQLPIPRLTQASPDFQPIVQATARLISTAPEFDDLAKAAGLRGSVDGVTDGAGRAALRAELDGRVAHLYGLSESEFTHILGTFPLVAQEVKDAALAEFRRLAPPEGDPELVELVQGGESDRLEFKSSMRVPVDGSPPSKELTAILEGVIIKEIAAFLNAQGGTLLIGVDDAGRGLGLAPDYASSPKIADRDGFERYLRGLVDNALGETVATSLKVTFAGLDGKEVCRVDVPAGDQEAFVQVVDKRSGQKRHAFYVRSGNKAQAIPGGPEQQKYIRGRWR